MKLISSYASRFSKIFLLSVLSCAVFTSSIALAEPSDGGSAVAQKAKPLTVGSKGSDAKIRDIAGRQQSLNSIIDGKKALLVFYRGGWWPYCNTQLGQLQKIEAELKSLGYQIFAISPDKPSRLKESNLKHNLTYTLLSDSSLAAAKAYGVAFRVDEKTFEQLKGYGIDIEDASGQNHHLLPVPAVFLLDEKGVIKFAYANEDYKVRVDPAKLLEAARN